MAHEPRGNDERAGEDDEVAEDAGPTIPHAEAAERTTTLEGGVAKQRNPLRRLLAILGPGFITGASDDDPSGIGTYSVAGASLGYAVLWTAPLTFPLMASVQFICAKVGMVSGRGLAGVLRHHYPRWLLYTSVGGLTVANTVNAGVDIGAIGAALNLLVPVPAAWLTVPATALILGLQIWGSYRLIARVFKWLTLALFAYIGSALLAHPQWGQILRSTVVPTLHWDKAFVTTLVAILGTTISPYLFFWQASEEVEEEVSMGRSRLWQRRGASDTELEYAAIDVNIGMFFSNVVMYFIIFATAATLFQAGQTDISSAADAAEALRPLAGDLSSVLLAVGLVGSGFLAVPILTGAAAYALSEAAGWRYGLDTRPRNARQFYAVIVVATLVGMAINFVGINPIAALYWTAVINGVLAPPLLVLIMLIVNNPKVMGERVNNPLTNVLGWTTAALMSTAAVVMLWP
ncbi:MAG: divalent metal cation transporter [Dehalococcoidia bacterium]|nr:MAG: divalent metal cation transporter [Dehalococcoidia bacterium]